MCSQCLRRTSTTGLPVSACGHVGTQRVSANAMKAMKLRGKGRRDACRSCPCATLPFLTSGSHQECFMRFLACIVAVPAVVLLALTGCDQPTAPPAAQAPGVLRGEITDRTFLPGDGATLTANFVTTVFTATTKSDLYSMSVESRHASIADSDFLRCSHDVQSRGQWRRSAIRRRYSRLFHAL